MYMMKVAEMQITAQENRIETLHLLETEHLLNVVPTYERRRTIIGTALEKIYLYRVGRALRRSLLEDMARLSHRRMFD